ncbi:IS1595 family transposase [Deinococcus sp. VB343]|uniref:IS1595 family transposase n=1 Tax=Deinococcus sp. VB142 TaxID=3112952 RepID=A0AAU6Q5Q5_9DEIO
MKGKRGRGTAASDKPPVLGMIERGGKLVLHLCDNVQQRTIQPLITAAITPSTVVSTDEYAIYNRLTEWGYGHVTVNHGDSEYARDDDGDGINEVHVNTIEGVWSLLRSWLRPHRGISQRWLPLYLGFFQAMHNLRRRGQSLLGPLLSLLLTSAPRNPL